MLHFDEKTGKVSVRVTASQNVAQCEEQAYHTRQLQEKYQRMVDEVKRQGSISVTDLARKFGGGMVVNNLVNFATIVGSLVHHDVENYLRTEYLDLPEVIYSPSKQEESLIFQMETDAHLGKERDRKMTVCLANFKKFMKDFEPEVLTTEETMFGRVEGIDLKGTVDAVLAIENDILTKAINSRYIPKMHGPRVIIADWKSGSSRQPTHQSQISAYYHLASLKVLPRFLRRIPYFTFKTEPYAMDVYLGGQNYKAKMFKVNQTMFFLNMRKYRDARRIPFNAMLGKMAVNLAQYCLYCPHKKKCSVSREGDVAIWELPDPI